MNLQFHRSQLLYDITNYCYIEAHRLETEQNDPTAAHIIADVCAEGNIDRINRILSATHAAAIEALTPLTKTSLVSSLIANFISVPDIYEITIHPPRDISEGTAQLLSRLIHEYMVCRAVYEWLFISHPTQGAKWQEKAAEAAAALRSCVTSICTGTGVTTRKKHPF